MPFIVKADLPPFVVGDRLLISTPRFKKADPVAGDEIYLWHSETLKGHGLVGKGVIHAVSNDNPVDLAILVTAADPETTLGVTDLKAHRDDDDGSPIAGLAKLLYRHALNKVAALTDEEAAFLQGHWTTTR